MQLETGAEPVDVGRLGVAIDGQQVCPVDERVMEHELNPAVVRIGLQTGVIQVPWE